MTIGTASTLQQRRIAFRERCLVPIGRRARAHPVQLRHLFRRQRPVRRPPVRLEVFIVAEPLIKSENSRYPINAKAQGIGDNFQAFVALSNCCETAMFAKSWAKQRAQSRHNRGSDKNKSPPMVLGYQERQWHQGRGQEKGNQNPSDRGLDWVIMLAQRFSGASDAAGKRILLAVEECCTSSPNTSVQACFRFS